MTINDLDRDEKEMQVPARLLTLPVEERIEYAEKVIDEVARSIWGVAFSESDKRKAQNIAKKTLASVRRTRKLALNILERD